MDKILLKTKIGRSILAGIIKKVIKKELAIDAKIVVDNFEVTFDEDMANVSLAISATTTSTNVQNVVKKILKY